MTRFITLQNELRLKLLQSPVIDRGSWQSQKGPADPMRRMHEIRHETVRFKLPELPHELIEMVGPNMPWAEDHFQERVSGTPHNPPPSAEWWPFKQEGHKEHTDQFGRFSHTYPERFWAKDAGHYPYYDGGWFTDRGHMGIRFYYGDLNDLLDQMVENPYTRQAYLPIWFPEDLMAARLGQRVPCTLGYHFLTTDRAVDITYFIRSCDFVRHFVDDVYMAGRLCQWVVSHLNDNALEQGDEPWVPGEMIMRIGSLHCFVGDEFKMREQHKVASQLQYERYMKGLG